MMKGERLPKETVQAIQALREKGVSVRKTALILGVGKKSVERHGAGGTCPVDSTRTKKDRDASMEKIIDLSAERLMEVLESKEKVGPVSLPNCPFLATCHLSSFL